jgi:hypothetical protein
MLNNELPTRLPKPPGRTGSEGAVGRFKSSFHLAQQDRGTPQCPVLARFQLFLAS